MTAMDKQQLRWPILRVIRCLFCTDSVEIPDVNTSISGGGGEVDGGVGRPSDLKDVVGMRFEGVEFELEFPDIPERDGLQGSTKQRVRSPMNPTLSLEPVRSRYSLLGANATVLTSAACPSTCELGLLELSLRVSQLNDVRMEHPLRFVHSHHELLVVSDRAKHVVVLRMPVDILIESVPLLSLLKPLTATTEECPVYFRRGCNEGSFLLYASISLTLLSKLHNEQVY